MSERSDSRMVAGVHLRLTGRMVFGLLIIALGVVFTLDSLRLVEARPILAWWPIVPLVYGLMRLVGLGAQRNVGTGLFLTVVFGWMLLYNLDLVRFCVWDFWPVIFIVAGVSILTGGFRRRRAQAAGAAGAAGGTDEAQIDAFAFMSGSLRKITGAEFKGGYVTAIMGGHQ